LSSSTTAFHSGWCNSSPSATWRLGITRLCPLTHRVGIGDAERQFVLQQHPASGLLPVLVAGEESAKVGAIRVALAGIAWAFLGMM